MKTTNELKKGTRILLKNGWYATLMDNKKGNIRMAEVEGIFTEIGSIYASEIESYELESGYWEKPVLTDKQKNTIVMGGF
jgi:hypothetical protein